MGEEFVSKIYIPGMTSFVLHNYIWHKGYTSILPMIEITAAQKKIRNL